MDWHSVERSWILVRFEVMTIMDDPEEGPHVYEAKPNSCRQMSAPHGIV